MPLKHLPIQPNVVSIAPAGTGGREARKPSSAGLVIRTSRQWVLPPRPKPGRKPSCDPGRPVGGRSESRASSVAAKVDAKCAVAGNLGSTSGSGSGASATAPAPPAPAPPKVMPQLTQVAATQRVSPPPPLSPRSQDPAPQAALMKKRASAISPTNVTTPAPANVATSSPALPKKPTKTALKKEIQQLKLENFKLKQELGQLTGNLQDLKHRYSLCDVSVQLHAKKRSFLDSLADADSESTTTENFLKFEDDEDDEVPTTLMAGVGMKPTMSFSSQYSTRTNLTDDEDPGFSSSTPSSLFSAELQRSVTSSSFPGPTPHYSLHGPASSASPHHCTNSPSISKMPVASIDTTKFLDDYEQSDFYQKHRHIFEQDARAKSIPNFKDQLYGTPSLPASMVPAHPADMHLDAIKEEDLNFKLDHDFGNDDISILNFLEDHAAKKGTSANTTTTTTTTMTTTTSTTATSHTPRWAVKEEVPDATDLNFFQGFDPTLELPKNEFHIPPSLEELMGEQEPGQADQHPDNEMKREDDDDILRMDVFDFA